MTPTDHHSGPRDDKHNESAIRYLVGADPAGLGDLADKYAETADEAETHSDATYNRNISKALRYLAMAAQYAEDRMN